MTQPTMQDPELLHRERFRTPELMREHPLVLRDPNKQVVYEIACPAGSEHQGGVEYSRWGSASLTRGVSVDLDQVLARMSDQPGFYDYAPFEALPDAVQWHLNFADPLLFGAYGSRYFAQDEIQVAEHPALGAVREALIARDLSTLTVEDGSPTPVLVAGVEHRCQVATEPNADEGRPSGIYGRAFGTADQEAVQQAKTRIDPPTVTNVVAMAAPAFGTGRYTDREIAYVVATAYAAFRAAVLESGRIGVHGRSVAVHTGFWGCGAFGGNRLLMTTIQAIAAQMAGLDRIVFHTSSGAYAGAADLVASRRLITGDLIAGSSTVEIRDLIQRIFNVGLEWGSGDAN